MSVDQSKTQMNNEISDKDLDGVVGGNAFTDALKKVGNKIESGVETAYHDASNVGQQAGKDIGGAAQTALQGGESVGQGLLHGGLSGLHGAETGVQNVFNNAPHALQNTVGTVEALPSHGPAIGSDLKHDFGTATSDIKNGLEALKGKL